MTLKVSIPVLEIEEVATWLSTESNDLKTFIENLVNSSAVPDVTGNTGKVLTNNGSVASWALLETLLPVLLEGKYLSVVSGNLSWEAPNEVPDTTGVTDGYVVTKNGSGYAWAAQSLSGQSFTVIDEQTYTSGNRGTTLWEKPGGAVDSDLVVIRGWGGGGSGGICASHYTIWWSFASGGEGGYYLETVCRVADLEDFMIPAVGAGGKATTLTTGGGSGSTSKTGTTGERTVFAARDGNTSRDITLIAAVECIVTDSGHPYSNGDLVVLHELDSAFLPISNRVFTVEVINSNSYYLIDASADGDRLDTSAYSPAVPNSPGKICKVASNPLLDVGGGDGGKGFAKLSSVAGASTLTSEDLATNFSQTPFNSSKGSLSGVEIPISEFFFRGGTPPTSGDAFYNGARPHGTKMAGGGSGACSRYRSGNYVGGLPGLSSNGGTGGTLTITLPTSLPTVGAATAPGGGGAGVAFSNASFITAGAGAYGQLVVTVIRTTFPLRGRWDYNWCLPDGGSGEEKL